MSEFTWIFVASPEDIAAALGLPLLTFTDTLHHHYTGVRHEVRGVKDTYTMYPIDEIEDWIIQFFPKQSDDAALARIYEKSIPIRRKLSI